MELRAAVQSLSFKSSFGWCDVRNAEVGRDSPYRVHFPVCVRSVAELTPKELHHKRKKEEWKRLRKARRMEKLAEQAREQAKGQERKQARRREGLCSFEKYKLAKERGDLEVVEWKSGVQGKSTLMSKFEEEFAMRVKEAVSSIKPVTTSDGEDSENLTRFREDSHSVFGGETEDGSDDWLLSYGRRSNDDGVHFERIADDGNIREAPSGSNLSMEDDNSRSIRDDVQRDKGTADRVVVGDARPQHDNLELRSESGTGEVESTFSDQDERVDENSTMNTSSRSEYRFIDHSFTDEVPMGRMRASTGMYNNGVGMHRRDEADAGTASDRSSGQEDLGTLYPRDWRVNPKTPRQKDRLVARQIIDRRKGEPLSTLLDANLGDITPGNYGILDALHEDVTSEVWRKPVDEREQLEWLVQELLQAGQKQKFFLSRLMHGARLKWTDGRLLELVKMLGARREWRRAMEVVHWVHCREHFSHCRSRYVCTTLLAVLGKCLRPVEALNVFNVMREEHSTYPDMAAYHSIAVTLGKAGHLTQLLHLIESLREGPVKKDVRGSPRQLNWNGRLEPDIVVYNAVINACGPHRQWEGTEWVLQQLQSSGIRPNSTTYGLAIEVMVKSGQYAKAWKYYEIMERGDFLPNALTFKALVEALGTTGEVDKAIEMVEEMEHRGILENAGVYYALASALCAAGRLSEALVQVDKLLKIPSRKPDVVTFTGLIRTCEKVGRWQDAISLFNRMQYVCAPNVGTYNIMIALYGRHRMFEEARDMFELVKKGKHKNSKFSQSNSRLSPTEYTYESMLGACAACEDWGYFEVVLEEFNTRGFQLDCRRHAWFISPIVKAGQERLIHSMVTRLQRPGEPPSADLYRVLFPLLSMHGYHTLVLNYLNGILQRGVALDTPEWSSIVGNAVDQLPMVDAEQFICTLGTEAKVHDDISVKKLLQCLVSVGAETKARRLVNLLGLEVDEFTPVVDATQGVSRLLPQEEEKISSSVLENKKVERMAEVQELDLNDIPSIHNNATVKAIDDGLQFQVRSQQIQQPQGEKVLCGPRIVRGGFGVEQPSWLIH